MTHWSRYWHSPNVINSFSKGTYSEGYDGALRVFWEKAFENLPPQAVIVDLATGNGALALLAQDYSSREQQNFRLHGVDVAQIDPLAQFKDAPEIVTKLQKITFYSETAIEAMPFNQQSIDCFISQFGFEYAERGLAVQSLVSKLKPGGHIILMMHHHASSVCLNSQQGVDVLNEVIDKSVLFEEADLLLELASQAIPQLGIEGWHNYAHNQILSQSLQWKMDLLCEKYSTPSAKLYISDITRKVARLLQNIQLHTIDTHRSALASEYKNLLDQRMRLQDQLEAALTYDEALALVKQFEAYGVQVSLDSFTLNNGLFAWTLFARKPEARA